jgi:deazaflavin-dependent oxidoreductase (nitroreductase family)
MIEDLYRPNVLQRGVQRVAVLRPASWVSSHLAHRLDRPIFRLTDGRHTAVTLLTGLPVVLLTTTGAKSGRPRSVPLLGIPDGEALILVASNWGDHNHPAWYHNLKAYPDCTVAVNGRSYPCTAHELSGDDKMAAWQKAATIYPGYKAYKSRTGGRAIPIMKLTPRPE